MSKVRSFRTDPPCKLPAQTAWAPATCPACKTLHLAACAACLQGCGLVTMTTRAEAVAAKDALDDQWFMVCVCVLCVCVFVGGMLSRMKRAACIRSHASRARSAAAPRAPHADCTCASNHPQPPPRPPPPSPQDGSMAPLSIKWADTALRARRNCTKAVQQAAASAPASPAIGERDDRTVSMLYPPIIVLQAQHHMGAWTACLVLVTACSFCCTRTQLRLAYGSPVPICTCVRRCSLQTCRPR